ncbi:hypothetical protein OAG26_01690 [Flavobacteriales bacterium]|nr:hypothetical protein [Flavobacteriales bacterium]
MRGAYLLFFMALLGAGSSAAWQLGAFAPRPIIHAHEAMGIAMRSDNLGGLPDTINALFYGSGKCSGCHGEDPNDLASIPGQTFPMEPLPEGHDVNVVDDWRSSIMANSTKDPFWRAKVRHEVLTNPSHGAGLEDKCTSCHAPVGHFSAHHEGTEYYTLLEALTDSMALDGVNCAVCHQQDPEGIGTRFSGDMTFVEDTIFGPYGGGKDEYPVQFQPMQQFIGFYPMYGEHMAKSESCAACHSLITNSVDLEGEYTDSTVIEQATYHEWLNSAYAEGPNAVECQGCHVPRIDEPVTIAAGYAWLQPRSPFGLHYFVGGNTHMLRMLRHNVDSLDLSATEAQFDSTIARSLDMLENQTLEVNLDVTGTPATGNMNVEVELINLAGHKFPSGYPARRAWVELTMAANGDTVFHSGAWDPSTGSIDGQLSVAWEPHHDVIVQDSQVQIYELVLGDVNGDPTTLLERAYAHLKDNRMVPLGFVADHPVGDTTAVIGTALNDPNFNVDDAGLEGSGADRIYYQIPEELMGQDVDITCQVWYQSLPPKWVAPMLELQGDSLIDGFRALYSEFIPTPERVGVGGLNVNLVGTGNLDNQPALTAAPNPSSSGQVRISSATSPIGPWILLDGRGREVQRGTGTTQRLELLLPAAGHYVFKSAQGSLRLMRSNS